MTVMRMIRHLFATRAGTRRRFTEAVDTAVESAIQAAESRCSAEIRFAVETALDISDLWKRKSPRQRGHEVFAQLRAWDTELRNGVLIYVLIAERDVEIIADRGAAARIGAADWEGVCRVMEEHFRAGRFSAGAVAGVEAVGGLLARHYPAGPRDHNELPNQPTLL